MLIAFLKSSIAGHLAPWLTREDLGRLRLLSKKASEAVDDNIDLLRPFLPPCECGHACGGLCVCPYGSNSMRALHYARLTRPIKDCRGAWVGRCYWTEVRLASSPFSYGLRPSGVFWAEDRLRIPCVPKGRYLLMARLDVRGEVRYHSKFEFYAMVQSHDSNYCGDKNVTSRRSYFPVRARLARDTQLTDTHGFIRHIWEHPITVTASGQSVVLGMKCTTGGTVPRWTFDWFRLLPWPESVPLGDIYRHAQISAQVETIPESAMEQDFLPCPLEKITVPNPRFVASPWAPPQPDEKFVRQLPSSVVIPRHERHILMHFAGAPNASETVRLLAVRKNERGDTFNSSDYMAYDTADDDDHHDENTDDDDNNHDEEDQNDDSDHDEDDQNDDSDHDEDDQNDDSDHDEDDDEDNHDHDDDEGHVLMHSAGTPDAGETGVRRNEREGLSRDDDESSDNVPYDSGDPDDDHDNDHSDNDHHHSDDDHSDNDHSDDDHDDGNDHSDDDHDDGNDHSDDDHDDDNDHSDDDHDDAEERSEEPYDAASGSEGGEIPCKVEVLTSDGTINMPVLINALGAQFKIFDFGEELKFDGAGFAAVSILIEDYFLYKVAVRKRDGPQVAPSVMLTSST